MESVADNRGILKNQINKLVKLSTIPVMLERITRVAEDPDSSRDELVKVIEHDQALASRVLEMANAAYYGQRRKIVTLKGAVGLLGFETIKSLAISSTIFATLSSGAGEKVTEFWNHSFEVAKTSMQVAEKTKLIRPDATFVAGLLHDIGRSIFYQFFGDDYLRLSEESEDLMADEVRLYGASHAYAGSWFADNSNFPEDLVMAIRLHHTPGSYIPGENSYLLPVVYLADYIVSEDGEGPGVDKVSSPEHDRTLDLLHLDDAGLVELREELKSTREQTTRYYIG